MGREARSYTVPMTQSEQRKRCLIVFFIGTISTNRPGSEEKMERTVEQLKERIRAGGAKIPAEKVIKNGQLVNVMTSEIYPAEIAIYKDMIAAVGDEAEVADYIGPDTQIIDAKGRFLVPGMIDGHIHSECSKLSITSYAKAVVPHGTTSMISGLDEYISVSDLDGLQEIIAEVKKSPLKVFWGAPYKTPYTVPQSTVSFNFTKEVHQTVQKWPECFGVWETVTEFVQEEDEDTLGAIAEAGKNNLPVFGCAPMASGKKLNAYLCSGVRLDHESYDHVEVVEKMRKGMHMLIRESCVTHFLAENVRAVTEVNPYLARQSQLLYGRRDSNGYSGKRSYGQPRSPGNQSRCRTDDSHSDGDDQQCRGIPHRPPDRIYLSGQDRRYFVCRRSAGFQGRRSND